MAHEESQLRPETVALDALIKATVAGLAGEGEQAPPEAMLFLGNWHQSIPSLVIQDPILEPVDKVVWMVIMSHARETGSRTAFPDYDTIASQTNIASTSTVARAIAILRLTRWLTLCARARQKSGRFTGNIYVLHDEPLPLTDALHLDTAYMAFVQQSEQHHHGRVRAVAQSVLASLDEAIRTEECPLAPESAIERRIAAVNAVRNTGKKPGATGRYFAFTGTAVNRLQRPASGRSEANPHRNQNSKAVKATHYSSGRSSDYKKTTTTTTTTNSNSDETTLSNQASSLGDAPLIYPARLSDNQKRLADRYLHMIAPEERQDVLDELQGRLESEQKGMKPVYDELRFLHSLCKAVQRSEFVPNLGIKVAEARASRAQPPPQPPNPEKEAIDARQREIARDYGLEQLAKLRQSFVTDDDT